MNTLLLLLLVLFGLVHKAVRAALKAAFADPASAGGIHKLLLWLFR